MGGSRGYIYVYGFRNPSPPPLPNMDRRQVVYSSRLLQRHQHLTALAQLCYVTMWGIVVVGFVADVFCFYGSVLMVGSYNQAPCVCIHVGGNPYPLHSASAGVRMEGQQLARSCLAPKRGFSTHVARMGQGLGHSTRTRHSLPTFWRG